ncbi:hypothetical protein Pfo_026422, partial [Paulownia fortunei]
MGWLKTPTISTFLVILLLGEMAIIISSCLAYSQKIHENQSEKRLILQPEEMKHSELWAWKSWAQTPPLHRLGCHKKPWSPECFPWTKKKPPPPPPGSRHGVGRPTRPPRPPRHVHW